MAGTPQLPADCAERYRADSLLGEGAYGEVWKATQLELDRPVALKVLRAGRSDEPEEVARFLSEARITAGLSHPGIVIVLDYGHEGGYPWIAYEYLPGASLAQLNERGRLGVARVVKAGVQIADALHHAHQRGVLHRDVKPENVLEVEPDRYKVSDFGIAKWSGAGQVRTRTGLVIGSPNYLAPEVIAGQAASARSDVYALAISLYELLSGRAPFDSPNIMEVLQGHLQRDALRIDQVVPEVSPELAAVIHCAMEREPEGRFDTAAAFAAALTEAVFDPDDPSGPKLRAFNRPSGKSSAAVKSLSGRTAAVSALSGRHSVGQTSVILAAPPPQPASIATRVVICAGLLAALALPVAHWRGRPAIISTPAPVAVPVERPFALAELDWLSDRTHVMAYLRRAAPGDAAVELIDIASGRVLGRREIPRDSRDFRHTFGNLEPRREMWLRVTPVGPGTAAQMRVHTQSDASAADVAGMVRGRLGKGPGNTIIDEGTRLAAGDGEKVEQSTFLMFSMGKLLRLPHRLADRDHLLLATRPSLRVLVDHPVFTLDDVHAACDLAAVTHEGAIMDALDQRIRKELPAARPFLLRPSLSCRLAGAETLARNLLDNPNPWTMQCREYAVTVLARQQPFGPEGALAFVKLLEELPGVPTLLPTADELIQLDPGVARERFTLWATKPSDRSDLVTLALCGLGMLGADADLAPLRAIVAAGSKFPQRHGVCMRMLAHLGTLRARELLGQGLTTLPSACSVWSVARAGSPVTRPVLEGLLATGVPEVRLAAAAALGNLGLSEAGPALAAALQSGTPALKRNAAWALGQLKYAPARNALRAFALSPVDGTGVGAWALAQLDDRESAPALVKLHASLADSAAVCGPDARLAVVSWSIHALGLAYPAPGAAPYNSGSFDLQRLAGHELPPQLGPTTQSFVQFPFIVEQRTGIHVAAGSTVHAVGLGKWGCEDQDLREMTDYVFYKSGGNVRSGLWLGPHPHQLSNWPSSFLARTDGELSLTSTPTNDVYDQSGYGTEQLRGIGFVQIAVDPPPGAP